MKAGFRQEMESDIYCRLIDKTLYTDCNGVLKMKCLLLRVQSHRDLEKEIIASTENVLRVMRIGEVKTFSI
jgi:hypothetical protein